MIYAQDTGRTLAHADKTRLAALLKKAQKAVETLKKHREDNSWPLLNVSDRSDDLAAIEQAGGRIAAHFETLVVIGMGGSSRGGRTLAALTDNPFAKPRTKILFLENIDPFTADQLLSSLDLQTTMFLLISKSGDTAETLAHTLVLIEAVSTRLGEAAIRDHFLIIAAPGDSALRLVAEGYGINTLDHDPNIGGRFAALTAVGLLPARVAGLDIAKIRKGAASVLHRCFKDQEAEPIHGAALSLALAEAGKSVAVLMPYCDRLNAFGAWYQQLWAESLGKDGHGTTPLAARGASDQHSLLQLYLCGPRDKFFTFVLLAQKEKGPLIPSSADKTLSYLRGKTIGDLMDAEQRATVETLSATAPVRVLSLAKLDEQAIGALMMHFMLETIIAAEILGINAFDQPAVEQGKKLSRKYLAGGA